MNPRGGRSKRHRRGQWILNKLRVIWFSISDNRYLHIHTVESWISGIPCSSDTVLERFRFRCPKAPHMATARSPNHSSEEGADPTPFLGTSSDDSNSGRRLLRRPSLREAARFLRQASGRRLMREPSMVVREAAAEQLEERQSDWAYSKPVVVLDILWNFAFVAAAATVLILGRNEKPNMPLRLWIVGYAMQCVLHVGCVCVEYRRRQRRREQSSPAVAVGGSGDLSSASIEDSRHYLSLPQSEDGGIR